jgi:hypothetical protein
LRAELSLQSGQTHMTALGAWSKAQVEAATLAVP